MRSSACLLSQVCAKNTESRPKRPAKAIMTMVLVRTTDPCLTSRKHSPFFIEGTLALR